MKNLKIQEGLNEIDDDISAVTIEKNYSNELLESENKRINQIIQVKMLKRLEFGCKKILTLNHLKQKKDGLAKRIHKE